MKRKREEYLLRDVRRSSLEDAARLADLWNRSDAGWPGGFRRGLDASPQRQLEELKRSDALAMCVVECGDEIVGYVDLLAQRGQKESTYVGFLNARPDHHGKGVGRMLMREMVRRSILLKFKMLSLYTWPGNTKAVPLYKKTGFFWVPETDVRMENFIPTILNIPLTKDFFARHDWYKIFKRDLQIKEDEIRWHGVRVFDYLFEAEGKCYRFIFDKEAKALTGIETPDFRAAAFTGLDEVPALAEHKIKWRFENKNSRPLKVSLRARGEPGIDLKFDKTFTLHNSCDFTAAFSVSPEIKRKEPGFPAHKIKSWLKIGRYSLLFETGTKVVQPVEISVSAEALVPGKEGQAEIKLRNRMDFSVSGKLMMEAPEGLEVESGSEPFSIPAKSWAGVPVWLKATKSGAFPLMLMPVFDRSTSRKFRKTKSLLAGRKKRTYIKSVGPGDIIAFRDEESSRVILESETLQVAVEQYGGRMRIIEKSSDKGAGAQTAPQLGPPFPTWHPFPPKYKGRLRRYAGKAEATLTIPSSTSPGSIVEKTVTLSPGPVISIGHRVVNSSKAPFSGELQVASYASHIGNITIPAAEGIITKDIRAGEYFPRGGEDLSVRPEDYAETWMAEEGEKFTTGLLWQGAKENEFHWGVWLTFEIKGLKAGRTQEIPPVYIYVGGGDWRTVRNLWKRLIAPSRPKEIEPPKRRPVFSAGLFPSPVILTRKKGAAKLMVENRRGLPLKGSLKLSLPPDIFIGREKERKIQFPLEGVKKDAPKLAKLEISTPSLAPRPLKADLTIRTRERDFKFQTPIVVLGERGRKIKIKKGKFYSVDNGLIRFSVSREHHGALFSLMKGKREFLTSSYPRPYPFIWSNRWFGGIHPFLKFMGDRILAKEKFRARICFRKGERGNLWQGVRISCEPEHKDYRWLRLESEYLTTAGSNLLAIILRVKNKTTAFMKARVGMVLWCAPGGKVDKSVIHYKIGDKFGLRRRGPFSTGFESKNWLAIENPETHDIMTIVVPDDSTRLEAIDTGRSGAFASVDYTVDLEREFLTREFLIWLVLPESVKEARGYEALKELDSLP